ncbi:MAG TPA: aldo/keto reductase [Armatimonadetes bacterium]|nr:aldo/keto reductase [Armatimonadota bacterium]
MLRRQYGTTGKHLSVLGFGCMRYPRDRFGNIDEDLTLRMLKRAAELGINIFDTAAIYDGGRSEEILGRALREIKAEVYVSTKNHYKGRDRGEWRRVLEGSLRRLDIEQIHFYHFHDLRWEQFREAISAPGGPLEEARRAKEEGIIGHLCFSSHDSPENVIRLIETGEFEGLLVQYNLLDRKYGTAIERAVKKGMGVLVMGPVGGGRLATLPGREAEALRKAGMSPAELALRFVLSNPFVTSALSGMNSFEMLEENVKVASRGDPLSDTERRLIKEVAEGMRGLSELYCTSCGYCLPCPYGVDIPGNFTAMLLLKLYGLPGEARAKYRSLLEEGASADLCVECGECLEKCPQKIPIPERLKEVERALGEGKVY